MDKRTFLKIAGAAIASPIAYLRLACASPDIAVVLDDAGESIEDSGLLEKLRDRNVPVTISMLPYSRHEQKIAGILSTYPEAEIFMHQPMQPIKDLKYWVGDHKEKAISYGTDVKDYYSIIHRNTEHLNQILGPYERRVTGMNNHMGSLVTQDKKKCEAIARACKNQGLILLDSVTIPESQLYKAGINNGIRTYKRNINWLELGPASAFNAALKQDSAVLIGHMKYSRTIDAVLDFSRFGVLRRISELQPYS